MNIPEITLKQFTNAVHIAFEIGREGGPSAMKPILGLGKPGIGKTEGIVELANKLGIGYRELRLVSMSECDLLGVPYTREIGNGSTEKVTDWASNKLLPYEERDGKEGILVLDEITSCSNSLRTCCLQLLDSQRSFANYKLPDGWLVVALGNGEGDGGDFQGLEGAFLNRFVRGVYHVNSNLEDWTYWAVQHDVHPAVVAFLRYMPDMIHTLGAGDDVDVFASPRAWTGFSQTLKKIEAISGGMADMNDTAFLVEGAVSATVAQHFIEFYEYSKSLVSADDILSGKIKECKEGLKQQELLLIGQSLVNRTANFLKMHEDVHEQVECLKNFTRFITSIDRLDITQLIASEVVGACPEVLSILAEDEFYSSPEGKIFNDKFVAKVNAAKRG